jgi:hypothetical protein
MTHVLAHYQQLQQSELLLREVKVIALDRHVLPLMIQRQLSTANDWLAVASGPSYDGAHPCQQFCPVSVGFDDVVGAGGQRRQPLLRAGRPK